MTGFRSALQALNVNVELVRTQDDDPSICPACHKRLHSSQGVAAHLRTARSCQWYKKGKLRALTLPGQFGRDDEIEMREVDESFPAEADELIDAADPGQVMQDFHDQLLDLVPIPSHSPGPQHHRHDPDENADLRMEVPHPTAGRVVRVDETVYQRWRRDFSGVDEEGDVCMDDVGLGEGSSAADNRFAPFASELDWRVACWAIQDGIGHKSFDRLMAISGVRAINYGIEVIFLTLCDRLQRSLVYHTRTYADYTRSLMEYLLVLPGRSESYGLRTNRRIST
jgi:hypothetical protein